MQDAEEGKYLTKSKIWHNLNVQKLDWEPLQNNHYISDHFVTAPYAGHGISMLRLFLNDGLGDNIMITQLRNRSQVTLPSEIVKKMRLQEGDKLEIIMEEDKIIIKPVLVIDRSQSWFWSKRWQEMEKEADEDIKHGRVHKAKNVEELIEKLDS